jgi:DHA2 family methylenomycin A resistance protein-like MFS transporter
LAVPLAAAGFGMSFTMPAATTAVLDAVSADRAGLAAGVLNAARQVGGVIGVAVLGGLVAATGPAVISGFRVAVAIAGGAFWLAAAVAAGTVAHDRPPVDRRPED